MDTTAAEVFVDILNEKRGYERTCQEWVSKLDIFFWISTHFMYTCTTSPAISHIFKNVLDVHAMTAINIGLGGRGRWEGRGAG